MLPVEGDLAAMFRRRAGAACEQMIRPPDWSPARDLDICGRCRHTLEQHACRIAGTSLSDTHNQPEAD